MADPIKWKSKIALFELEATYGTDPAPTGADHAMLFTDLELRPMEGQDVSRNLERPFLGAQETIPAGLYVTLTGSVELQGSGVAGTPPAWGPLLRACGAAETITAATSVAYTPVSDEHESGCFYFWMGPTRHIIKGCRGTGTKTVNAQGIPVFRFTLMGLFTTPADAARAVPDLSAFVVPQIASKVNTPTFTVGAVPMVLSQFSFNLGNDVQQRLLIGREEMLIVDRAESIAARVEAVPLATYNPYAISQARTRQAVTLVHGTTAGKIITFSAPSCSLGRLTGYEQSQNITEWPLALTPLPVDGDDQWSLTLT